MRAEVQALRQEIENLKAQRWAPRTPFRIVDREGVTVLEVSAESGAGPCLRLFDLDGDPAIELRAAPVNIGLLRGIFVNSRGGRHAATLSAPEESGCLT